MTTLKICFLPCIVSLKSILFNLLCGFGYLSWFGSRSSSCVENKQWKSSQQPVLGTERIFNQTVSVQVSGTVTSFWCWTWENKKRDDSLTEERHVKEKLSEPQVKVMNHSSHCRSHLKKIGLKMKLNEPGGHIFLTVDRACKAMFWSTPGYKQSTFDSSRFSGEGALISASTLLIWATEHKMAALTVLFSRLSNTDFSQTKPYCN